ncbi:hypothetical protein F2Q69_00023037 [Brassica cretica]|uniref:Uncharacterized protein n=1 Tax=Brassica cretica TaxID=69181 RepID=A0A8S9QCD1_BRACR|nr:hypothetical protein F2Q69_00023037 [Brassica cretica]
MRRCPYGGDWSELAESLMEIPGTQDFSLHFWRLYGSMNRVEEWGTFSMFVLVLGDNLVDSWYQSKILGHVVCGSWACFPESEDLEIHPSETHGSWVQFFINRRLYGLSSRNLETGWTFVLEPGGWMDSRVISSSAPVSRLLLIVCDIALCPHRQVSHSTSLRLVSIDINSPTKGPWTFVSGPEAVYNPEILRSYLDPEVMWEPGGSPFDPEIVSGPGGHVGTRRSFGNPEVPLDPKIVSNPEVFFGPGDRFEPGGFSGPGGHLGTQRFLLDPEVVLNPEVALDTEVVFRTRRSNKDPKRFLLDSEVVLNPGLYKNLEVYLFQALRSFQDPETEWGPEGTVLRLPRQDYSRYLFGFRILPLGSWPLSSSYVVFYFCRKSLTGLEGASVGVMTQVPGLRCFPRWEKQDLDCSMYFTGWMQGSKPELPSTGTWRPVSCPRPGRYFPTSLPLISCFRPQTRGITCALKSTGVAHSQQAFPGQDIAPVILLSQGDSGSWPCMSMDGKTYSWGSWPEVVLSWLAQDLMEWASTEIQDPGLACQWMARLVGLAGEDHLYLLKSTVGDMLPRSKEDDLLKKIRPDSRMKKFCTRLLRASCSDPVGPVHLSWGTWRWTTLDVDWMWAVVEIAHVPFCGAIRSAFKIYGTASWSGGSGIYPPETWRFVGLVPRNPEFVELILLEPEGFEVDPTEIWRTALPVYFCSFRRRSMTRSSCSLPLLG